MNLDSYKRPGPARRRAAGAAAAIALLAGGGAALIAKGDSQPVPTNDRASGLDKPATTTTETPVASTPTTTTELVPSTTTAPVETTSTTMPDVAMPPISILDNDVNGGTVERSPEEVPPLTAEDARTRLKPWIGQFTRDGRSVTTEDANTGITTTNFNREYQDGPTQGFWNAVVTRDTATQRVMSVQVGAFGGNLETGENIEPGVVAKITFADNDVDFSFDYSIASTNVPLDVTKKNQAYNDMLTMSGAMLGEADIPFANVPLQVRV